MTKKPWMIVIAGILLAVQSAAQQQPPENDPCLVSFDGETSVRVCCIGANCGATLTNSLDNPTPAHCHSINAQGEQCWDLEVGAVSIPFFNDSSTPTFDTRDVSEACEQVTGFNVRPRFSEVTGVQPPAAISCSDAGLVDAATQQLIRVGGYDLFRSQIRRTARPRIVREALESAAEAAAEAAGDAGSSAAFAEMTTSVEMESWELRGIGGETPGGRFAWRRQSESGHLLGLSASYQDSEPDFGDPSELLNASFSAGHTLGQVWSWSLSGTYSDLRGPIDDTLIGASGLIGFANYSPRGSVFSGGVIFQYLDSDLQPDELQTAGYGIAFGFPIGARLALDLEAYGVSILEGGAPIVAGEPIDDSFFTAAGMLSFYATPRFAVTLGYRTLEGVGELDSHSFTFGASTRWQ